MRNGDDTKLAKNLARWIEGEGGLCAYADEPIPPDLLDADGGPLDMVSLAQADPEFAKLWRRVETLARTVSVPRSRTVSDARSQAQGAAEKIAKLNCPSGVEILDKWVDYSMIDDEFVYATVVLVFEAPIGARHGAD